MVARAVLVLLAFGLAGAGLGALARSASSRPPSRPDVVERALRVLDAHERRPNPAALREAAASLGETASWPVAWREEADLVRTAASGDAESLWRFATTGPRSPARARALLHLAERGPDESARSRARARLAADYPASWALARGAK